MTIRRKPRKSPLNDFVSFIVPDRIEEAYQRVGEYFTEHLKLSFDSAEGSAEVINELFSQHGESARRALNGMLCDENGPLRPLINEAAGGGLKTALTALVPLVAAQFALAPAVALLVVTLVVKAASVNGEKMLCEALVRENRKSTRHMRSVHAHNRSVQDTKNASRRRQAAKAENSRRSTGARPSTPAARRSGIPSVPRKPKPPKAEAD